jgi:SSS family solute:Na+ symporter
VTAAAVVFAYLVVVLYVGIFAFRRGQANKAEDFFVANRSLGTFVFLLSLFGSNMTSFAILGSIGPGVSQRADGLRADGVDQRDRHPAEHLRHRHAHLGDRQEFGHMTQVQIFRDRWEMGHIGTSSSLLQALMLLPYIIIGVMGGGETLEGVSGGAVPYWIGGAIVAPGRDELRLLRRHARAPRGSTRCRR